MNAGDWIALAGAVGALAAAAVAAIAAFLGRRDARKSAEAAEKSQKETERQVEISGRIADVADKTFDASSQPIIVSDAIPDPPFEYLHAALDERNRWTRAKFAVSIQYPIRNVGVGPALGLVGSLERGEPLTAEISYTGIGAQRRYLTRFVLKPRTHMSLKPRRPGTTRDFGLDTTQIYECDEKGNIKGPPIATNKLPDPDGS